MLNSKFISIYRVIESLYRDEGYTQQINKSDMLEWIGEAIDLLRLKLAYIEKVTGTDANNPTIKIENYRGELPCDLHSIIQVREYCAKIPMRMRTDTFHHGNKTDIRVPDYNYNQDITYSINDNYIFTSVETMEVEMSYLAYKLDEDGYPMIPEDTLVVKAIKAYLTYKLDHRLWRNQLISDKVYTDSEQEWYLTSKQAMVRASTPSWDQLESFKNQWLRLIPKINEQSSGYAYLGQQEERYNR